MSCRAPAMYGYIWLLLAAVKAQGISECFMRDRTIGECRLFRDCPNATKNAFGPPSTPVGCGFAGNELIVCCRKSSAGTGIGTGTGTGTVTGTRNNKLSPSLLGMIFWRAKAAALREAGGDYDSILFVDPKDVPADAWRAPERLSVRPTATVSAGERKASTTAALREAGGDYDSILFVDPEDVPADAWRAPVRLPVRPTATVSAGERKASTMCKRYADFKDSLFNPQILRGTIVAEGSYPHMAALGYPEEAGLQFRCGGSLLSDRFVLTAAHCLIVVGGTKPSLVRLGVVDLQKENLDTAETDYLIGREFVHASYDRLTKINDIALLRLTRTVTFTITRHPACLYTSLDNPREMMTITGWGKADKRGPETSRVLLKASVSAVATAACNRQFNSSSDYRRRYPDGYLPSQMCARDLINNSDTCTGDSGGPAQLPLEDTQAMHYVVGVTSFGRNCGVAVPGLYTRVASYLDWIEGIVWP